jgi:hypothetical protein
LQFFRVRIDIFINEWTASIQTSFVYLVIYIGIFLTILSRIFCVIILYLIISSIDTSIEPACFCFSCNTQDCICSQSSWIKEIIYVTEIDIITAVSVSSVNAGWQGNAGNAVLLLVKFIVHSVCWLKYLCIYLKK